MADGWYSSFKWLTGKKWVAGTGMRDPLQEEFYRALMKHIGHEALGSLQERARDCCDGDKKPVAPDLWIIEEDRTHHFIESKLPDDTLRPPQTDGLLLIAEHLEVAYPVKVSVITLYPDAENQ